MYERLRRLRRTPALREIVCETSLRASDFIYPIFVREGIDTAEPIAKGPFCTRPDTE